MGEGTRGRQRFPRQTDADVGLLARIFHNERTRMGGTGHRPVRPGDWPDESGTTPCGKEYTPTVGAPSSFRPASGRAARASRRCHPDKCEISGLNTYRATGPADLRE